ncbi:MAG: hypothetical protein AAFR45_11555, partial [Pseudomonadota bacterium]
VVFRMTSWLGKQAQASCLRIINQRNEAVVQMPWIATKLESVDDGEGTTAALGWLITGVCPVRKGAVSEKW